MILRGRAIVFLVFSHPMTNSPSNHFKGKEAIGHVAEAQAEGLIKRAESHSEELPGTWTAGADAARDTAMALLFLFLAVSLYEDKPGEMLPILAIFGLGWLLWRAGRSAWLGWARLERLHRILEEEKWEIEHNREQERDELRALYEAKGFQGKLLDEVIAVLMADEDRLLRVMVEEELGLCLEAQDHPLKQAFGAALGSLISLVAAALFFLLSPAWGIPLCAFLVLAAAAWLSAGYEKNRVIPAMLWAVGIGVVAFGAVFFLLDFVK